MNYLPTDALIVIDLQNDFLPGGALAVARGDEIVEPITALTRHFRQVGGGVIALTQDWHPKGHKSFATTWYMDPYAQIQMDYGNQTLWPDHCVQGTQGAEFHGRFRADAEDDADIIIRKGTNLNIDSYSAFVENDKVTKTGLAGYLREKGVKRVFLVGLAYDFCVGYSALDAVKAGFEAIVLKDLTRSIAMPQKVIMGTEGTEGTEVETNSEIIMDSDLRSSGVKVLSTVKA